MLDGIYRTKLTDKQALQVYRLSAEVGAMQAGTEYSEMAELALSSGSPGEAVAILNKGVAAKVFTTPADQTRSQHLLDTAKKQAAADQPTLDKTETDAANDAKGDRLVGAGIGYFGYGDYARAVKDISAGLAKGMAKDSVDARLLLGIAQFRTGDKDAAMQTFIRSRATRSRSGWRSCGLCAPRPDLDSVTRVRKVRIKGREHAPGFFIAKEFGIMSIKAGDRMPSGTFKTTTTDGRRDVTTDELFKGKKVVLFAVPGAFTPTCDAKHLPASVQLADQFRAKGVATIACFAVNDVFVMGAWGKHSNVGDKVLLLADGNGDMPAPWD